MADKLLPRVAQLTGLHYYANRSPFPKSFTSKGAVIGNKEGFLVTIAYAYQESTKSYSVDVLIDCQAIANPSALKTELQNAPAIQGAIGKHLFAKRMREQLEVDQQSVRWHWYYSVRAPQAEDISALLTASVGVLAENATKFDGKCSVCQTASVSDIVLANGMPVYVCIGCQQKQTAAVNAAALAFDQMPLSVGRGIALGIGAAILGAIAWAVVALLLDRIFAVGALAIGALVGAAVHRGMGKVSWLGRVLVVALTILSVLGGDYLFFVGTAMRDLGVPLSGELLILVLQIFWELEGESTRYLSLVFALIGAGYVLFTIRKPKIRLSFEPIERPTF